MGRRAYSAGFLPGALRVRVRGSNMRCALVALRTVHGFGAIAAVLLLGRAVTSVNDPLPPFKFAIATTPSKV